MKRGGVGLGRREREREREKGGERGRGVREREREREREVGEIFCLDSSLPVRLACLVGGLVYVFIKG